MALLGKWLGYEKTLAEAKNAMLVKDERINRLEDRCADLVKANTRIGRLCAQIKKLGGEPVN